MGLGRSPPDSGFGAAVELRGRDRRGLVDLAVVGAGLSREGGAAEQPPVLAVYSIRSAIFALMRIDCRENRRGWTKRPAQVPSGRAE